MTVDGGLQLSAKLEAFLVLTQIELQNVTDITNISIYV